jgi:cytoskeletal protein RodZ
MDTVGKLLQQSRIERQMSVVELARITRIPVHSLEAIEENQFDSLPGEVFARGFLKAYARAVGLDPEKILAEHASAKAPEEWTPPLPLTADPAVRGRRFGVAIAVVLLLVLFTLALSIVLKPRGRDIPQELSLTPNSQVEFDIEPNSTPDSASTHSLVRTLG